MSFKALERAYNEAKQKSEREHVTWYLYNHPSLFKTYILGNDTDDSGYRFTVDEKEDLEVTKAIVEALHKDKGAQFTVDDIKVYLDEHPQVAHLNAHVVRNQGLQTPFSKDFIVQENKKS